MTDSDHDSRLRDETDLHNLLDELKDVNNRIAAYDLLAAEDLSIMISKIDAIMRGLAVDGNTGIRLVGSMFGPPKPNFDKLRELRELAEAAHNGCSHIGDADDPDAMCPECWEIADNYWSALDTSTVLTILEHVDELEKSLREHGRGGRRTATLLGREWPPESADERIERETGGPAISNFNEVLEEVLEECIEPNCFCQEQSSEAILREYKTHRRT